MNLRVRKGSIDDIDTVLDLFENARRCMRANGNLTQWANGYPARADTASDVSHDALMICEDADTGEVVGTFCMQTWPEYTYTDIYEGAWPDQMPYGTVHRMAAKYQGRGIGAFCLAWAQERFGCLRADTHADNTPMQATLAHAGFAYCGIVYMDDGSPRKAFFWRR